LPPARCTCKVSCEPPAKSCFFMHFNLALWPVRCGCDCTGLQDGVPTRHSIALCALFGPLGLLSDGVTRLLGSSRSGSVPDGSNKSAGGYNPT
jgi:hypothetical protein